MNTHTASTQAQLTPATPSAQDSLARIAASLTELVQIQRETMASISGLWEMTEQASEIQRMEWLERENYRYDKADKRLLALRLGSDGALKQIPRTIPQVYLRPKPS
jgi:hypothetical protein